MWVFTGGGEWRVLSVSSKRLSGLGREDASMLLLAYDVTAITHAQRERERLSAIASHELKHPLTVMIGNADLALEDPDLSPRLRERLETILRASERVLEMTSSMLKSSRTAFEGRESYDDIDMRQIVVDSVDSFRPTASAHDVVIQLDVNEPLPATADGFRMRQVIDNLVSNAIKYTPRDGDVRIAGALDGDTVSLTVSDTGIGISAEDLPNIMTPYFRTSTAKDTASGTGLGLGITREIVAAHGGTLTIESDLGSGTTVTVKLPRFAPEKTDAGGRARDGHRRHQRRARHRTGRDRDAGHNAHDRHRVPLQALASDAVLVVRLRTGHGVDVRRGRGRDRAVRDGPPHLPRVPHGRTGSAVVGLPRPVGVRAFPWIGAVIGAASAVLLVAAGETIWFSPAYRAVFFAASVCAGLFFFDWVRVSARRDRITLPFAIMSLAFFAVGTANAVAGFLFPPTTGDDLALVRLVTSIGMLAYTACALVAVVGISTRDTPLARGSEAPAGWQRFELTATERLTRARASAEPWSLVYLRLDDATEIRQMGGSAALGKLSQRFLDTVREVFPAEADVGTPSPGTAVVLVPRSDAAVRDHLRAVLERISNLEVDMSLPIRPSASAGWAPVSVVGYDLDALLYMAREAATLASENGGDRWERVGVTVTDRLLNPLQRS
nr:hypothetical protein GCM10025699_03140 [Microbacterium flavescens]